MKMNEFSPSGNETVFEAKTLAAENVRVDLEAWKTRAETFYRSLGTDPEFPDFIPDAPLRAEIESRISLRGFNTALWVSVQKSFPAIIEILAAPTRAATHAPPVFAGGVRREDLSRLPEPFGNMPHIMLTSDRPQVPEWTLGLTPNEIRATLAEIGEQGLSLSQYLLLEQLQAESLPRHQAGAARLDERFGTMLLGSVLPDGRVLAINNSAAGRFTFTAVAPDQSHPLYGARSGLVIPLK